MDNYTTEKRVTVTLGWTDQFYIEKIKEYYGPKTTISTIIRTGIFLMYQDAEKRKKVLRQE